MSDELKIGDLAELYGLSRDALRFYERVGLLRPPRRTASGHRVYDEDSGQRLDFIRRSQQIGLTLEDIRELLRAEGLPGSEACARVAERLRARFEAVDQQLATFRAFRRRLAKALELCESTPAEAFALQDLIAQVGESASAQEE